jgi:hypothetical protein
MNYLYLYIGLGYTLVLYDWLLHVLHSDLLLKFTTLNNILTIGGLDSMVGTATCYGLESSGFEPRWARNFSFQFRPAPRPTKPNVQWVPGLFAGGKSCRGVGLIGTPIYRRS